VHPIDRPDDLDPLEVALLDAIGALPVPERPIHDLSLAVATADEVFTAQVRSRHLDHAARWLRARGAGFYTIGSAGHESNALVAAALRPTDPALLHYRSGGFYLARAQQVVGLQSIEQPLPGVRDVLAGLLGLADEPIAGGRHKVFGHPALDVIPQTSTIASHLPRAVGVAFAIERAARLGVPVRWADDAIAVCSFGDASVNHSTAQGAINTACYTAHSGLPLPLLFVCEDNGLGISVPTPTGWVQASLAHRPGLRYEYADGADPEAAFATVRDLIDWVRAERRPAVLHLRTVRFLAHAGTDVESAYRSPAAMRADLARDPIVALARFLVASGAARGADLVDRVDGGPGHDADGR
jgi:2-oxoisovalerate dehydrogenase E1 component